MAIEKLVVNSKFGSFEIEVDIPSDLEQGIEAFGEGYVYDCFIQKHIINSRDKARTKKDNAILKQLARDPAKFLKALTDAGIEIPGDSA